MAQIFEVGTVLTASVEWTDQYGNITTVDEAQPLQWTSSDETVATLTVAEDGAVTVTSTGKPGVVQVSVKADADRDEGEVRELIALGDLEFVPAEAIAGSVVFVD